MGELKKTNKRIKAVSIKPLYNTTAAQYYMDVRNGKRHIEYLHKDLEPILQNSNGVFVYQEEVMRFLVEVAGYTWEESDIIRSAIAKKKHDVIMATFDKIRASCKARGWDDSAIETVCQQIQAFSRYSFNKSHSHAYAELGYVTMYLKHHHFYEWWTAILNLAVNDSDKDKLRKYVSLLGPIVRPPSLANPSDEFSIREINGKKYIVTPISALKGCGPSVVKELCNKAPFTSLEDFVQRIDHAKINTGVVSSLVKARAADDLMNADIADLSSTRYPEIRKAFMTRYAELRNNKVKLKEDVLNYDPLNIFLLEKEYNQCFNKHLLSDPSIEEMIVNKLPAIVKTGRQAVPFIMKDVPIISSIKVAEGLVKNKHSKEIGMILIYESSTFKSGVSKTGRKWSCVSVELSDGYSTIECTHWDLKAALRWPKNSIVYVRGILSAGWKTSVNLKVSELEQIN